MFQVASPVELGHSTIWIAFASLPGFPSPTRECAKGATLLPLPDDAIHGSASPSPERPADWSDQSYYLAMRDGVRLAVSLYFPGHVPPIIASPILLVLTRYGRASARRSGDPSAVDPWLQAGYVVAIVDVRGTTSSFGSRDSELGPDEQRDAEEIIAHLA